MLDEPFSGLDPLGVATMSEILRERAAAGVGVVFSSHQLDLVEEVCEDVVIVSRGRVVADGEIDALKAASGRRHLEVEVAGSGGSWLDGTNGFSVIERDGDWVKLLVDEHADLEAHPAGGGRGRRGAPVLVRAAQALGAVHGGRHRAPAVGRGGGAMSRLRAIRLVAMREILERGRSRGYVLSLVFTVFLLVAGFVLPAFLLGGGRDPQPRARRDAAGRPARRRSRAWRTSTT